MPTPSSPPEFLTLLGCAADSVAALRRSDVFRVVATAQEAGCLAAFCGWLTQERPEFASEIRECVEDL